MRANYLVLIFTLSVVEFENLETQEEKVVVGIQDEKVVGLGQVSVLGQELVERPVQEADRLEQEVDRQEQRVG
jgi:predicted RNA-binding protein with PUA domain